MTIDIFAEFATDEKAEAEGTWVPYAGDVEFLIARSGNKAFNKLMAKRYKQNQRAVDAGGDAGEALSEKLIIEVMAKTILLGVKGDFVWKGQKAEFNEELAKEMLGVKEFRRWVSSKADDMSNFKLQKDEEDEKN